MTMTQNILVALTFASLVACQTKDATQSAVPTETRAAAIKARTNSVPLSGAECELPSKRNEPGCDWYYDPMRLSASADSP
jgi:hypothetical protein